MNETLKSLFMLCFIVLGLIVLMTYGFDAIAYTIHRANFESLKWSQGMPYSYEDLQSCNEGVYRNLEEYQEFFKYPTLIGSGILDKNKYYIISKRKANYLIGTPSWEEENPTYYYCLGAKAPRGEKEWNQK